MHVHRHAPSGRARPTQGHANRHGGRLCLEMHAATHLPARTTICQPRCIWTHMTHACLCPLGPITQTVCHAACPPIHQPHAYLAIHDVLVSVHQAWLARDSREGLHGSDSGGWAYHSNTACLCACADSAGFEPMPKRALLTVQNAWGLEGNERKQAPSTRGEAAEGAGLSRGGQSSSDG